MRETLLLIWKKSPLRILLVLAFLLLALGHFEYTARELRSRDIVIEVKSQKGLYLPENTINGAAEEEFAAGGYADDLEEWYSRLKTQSPAELRPAWDLFRQEQPESIEGEYLYFEIRLLMNEGRENAALQLLLAESPAEENADEYYLLKAVVENRLGLRAEAIASYQKLLEASPNSYPAHYNLGSLYYSLNRFTLAKGYLEEALKLAGGLKRAKTYRSLAMTLIKLENFQEAEEMLQESILLDPSGISSRLVLAELYSGPLNDIPKARETYEIIGRLSRDIPDLYLGLARIELAEDDWEQALEILDDGRLQVSDSLPIILETAKILIEYGDIQDALKLLEENRRIFPDNPGVYFQTGRLYYRLGELEKSAGAFSNAIKMSSGPYPEAINNLGLVYMAQELWDEAEAQYLQAVKINPWYETAWYNLGLVYLNQERWDDAVTGFMRTLQIAPEHQASWYNLGIVYSSIGQLDKAVEAYENSLKLLPEDPKARLNLAVLYRKKGDDARAQEQYRLVLEITPAYASAWFNLGLLQKAQGRYREAEESYRKAIELEADQEIYWKNLSSLLGSLNRTEQAVEVLSEALEIHPYSSSLRYNLALQYKKSGRIEDALKEVEVSLRLDPDFAKGWKTSGSLYSELGDHVAAADAFRRSAEIDDADKYIYYLLGKEQYENGELQAAAVSFEKALAEIGDNAFIWYNAGRAYQYSGRAEKASAYYSRALDINPDLVGNIAGEIELLDESGSFYYSKIEADPGNPEWPVRLSKLLVRKEDYNEAVNILLEAAGNFPGNAEVLTALAGTYELQEDLLGAEAYYSAALAVDPDNIDLYLKLGRLLEKTENPENAENYLLMGLELAPDNLQLLRLLGETYYEQKKYSETIEVLSRAVELDSASGSGLITLGKAYYHEKDYFAAEDAFSKGKIVQPDYVWSYIWHGRALRKLGRFDDAEIDFLAAVGIDSGHEQAWIALGDLYREMELKPRALEAYTRALDINPAGSTVRRRIESVSD